MPKEAQPVGSVAVGEFGLRLEQCITKCASTPRKAGAEGSSLQKKVGKRIGSQFWRYKNGSIPTLESVLAIAEAAEVNPAWLAFGSGPRDLGCADESLTIDPKLYTILPKLDADGRIDDSAFPAYLPNYLLVDSIKGFADSRLALFLITEGTQGPKFLYGEWVVVDINWRLLDTADLCLRSRFDRIACVRQITRQHGRYKVIEPQNGAPPETPSYTKAQFDAKYELVGRVVINAKWSVNAGGPL